MNGGDAGQTDETYDVAISYASEDRPYVQQVAAELVARGIRPFYDQNEEVALWGEDLFETLQDVYMSKSHLAVLFISEHYAKKEWTRLERRSALQGALQKSHAYVLPAYFDDTKLPGLPPGLGHQNIKDQSPHECATKIVLKPASLGIGSTPQARVSRAAKHPYKTMEKRSPLLDEGSPFWIDPQWREVPRNLSWTRYADVLVRPQEPAGASGRVFLIPSGAVPPSLSDPRCWGTTGLERKRDITNQWCEANLHREQIGFIFQMTNKQGKQVPRIYCDDYDRFLIEHLTGP